MPMYEFECRAGHVTEAIVPVGTKRLVCRTCGISMQFAKRILSATPTTFVFADTGRKRRR